MPALKYTTTIAAAKSLSQITDALAKHGASSIRTDYIDGKPAGLGFLLPTPHGDRNFALPVDVDAVHRLLSAQRSGQAGYAKNSRVDDRREQAERVAWRVLHDWLIAQLAIIEAQMVAFDQVMLPYLKVDDDRTLYAAFKEQESSALTAGGPAGELS